jgi:hypothetical protein
VGEPEKTTALPLRWRPVQIMFATASRCADGDGAIDCYLVGHDGLRHGVG